MAALLMAFSAHGFIGNRCWSRFATMRYGWLDMLTAIACALAGYLIGWWLDWEALSIRTRPLKPMILPEAIADVRAGHAQRIAAPGQWRVWRDGDAVRWEVFA